MLSHLMMHCSEYLRCGGRRLLQDTSTVLPFSIFVAVLMTGSSVVMYASERTSVLAVALQFKVVIGQGGC